MMQLSIIIVSIIKPSPYSKPQVGSLFWPCPRKYVQCLPSGPELIMTGGLLQCGTL